MTNSIGPILVFGATGQQGGAVARALLEAGREVRILTRNPAAPAAEALRRAGAQVFKGDFEDPASIRQAMQGAEAVFSVQTSSPGGEITDAQEIAWGMLVADLAVETGVRHLVYSSGAAVGEEPTGMGHFDSKMRIEAHIRTLAIAATIVRPTVFMEMLMMPGFGLDEGRFAFFMTPDQAMQFIAVEDIGKLVAAVFADRERFAGRTFDIAGDRLAGQDFERLFSAAADRPIPYARFSEEVLAANDFLAKLTALQDQGILAGAADMDALRALVPDLLSFETWLAGPGRQSFAAALEASGAWAYSQ
ncbi:NmrA/HSCARG family protein [uncultured Brevundimonas sp.]|uniref:NmrA/HSCARG family protein n=1 Tax=uncultured Brevundimonas sp. TaxID=213418 RepID=UPI00261C1367|nr:NmrA/HSCARG family protein [uncultured Brevundimonas sp.]